MSDKLLPCPFCGSSDIDPRGWSTLPEYANTPDERFGPSCDQCGASANSASEWNTRSNPSHAQLAAARSVLEKARTYIEYALGTHGNDVAGIGLAALNAIDATLAHEPAGQSEDRDEALHHAARLIAREFFTPTDFEVNGQKAFSVADWQRAKAIASAILALLPAGSASPGVTAPLDDRALTLEDAIKRELYRLEEIHPKKFLERSMSADAQLWQRLSAALSKATDNAAHPTVKVSGDAAEMRKVIADLFHQNTGHKDGCLTKSGGPCQCGWSEVQIRYNAALRKAKAIAEQYRALPLTPEGRNNG